MGEKTNAGQLIVWSCETDRGWTRYDDSISALLEEAYQDGQSQCEFHMNTIKYATLWSGQPTKYVIDWANFEQLNTKTLTRRAISREEVKTNRLISSSATPTSDRAEAAFQTAAVNDVETTTTVTTTTTASRRRRTEETIHPEVLTEDPTSANAYHTERRSLRHAGSVSRDLSASGEDGDESDEYDDSVSVTSPTRSVETRTLRKTRRVVYVQINAQLDKVDFKNRHFECDAFIKMFFVHDFKNRGHLKYVDLSVEGRRVTQLDNPGNYRNAEIYDDDGMQFPVSQLNMFHNTLSQSYKDSPLLAYDVVDGRGIVAVQYRLRLDMRTRFNLRTYPLVNLSLPLRLGLRNHSWRISYDVPSFLREAQVVGSPYLKYMLKNTENPFRIAVSEQLHEYQPEHPSIVEDPKHPVFKLRVVFNGVAHWTHTIFPMHLILSLMVFALLLPESQIESKMAVALGVLFGAVGIAERIAEREELDLLPYATVLDNYASCVFVLVWAITIVNFVLFYLHNNDIDPEFDTDPVDTTQRVMDTFKYPNRIESRIKIITAACFLLCWFTLLYVCVLFKRGDLDALEKAWIIHWLFVEYLDEDAFDRQKGRSFRKMIASPRAENVRKFVRAHSMAAMRSRRTRGVFIVVSVIGRWWYGRDRTNGSLSDRSLSKEKRPSRSLSKEKASGADAISTEPGTRGEEHVLGNEGNRTAVESRQAAVVPVMPDGKSDMQ